MIAKIDLEAVEFGVRCSYPEYIQAFGMKSSPPSILYRDRGTEGKCSWLNRNKAETSPVIVPAVNR